MTAPIKARLLYAESFHDADMLYFSGIRVPDAFAALQIGRRKIITANALEFARAKKQSPCKVLASEQLARRGDPAGMIAALLKQYKIKNCEVPSNFPFGLAQSLQQKGFSLKSIEAPFFKERLCKTPEEIKALQKANQAAAAGIAAAKKLLQSSRIRKGYLYHKGKRLSSEQLRTAVNQACLDYGGTAEGTICAGGIQGCDPHERGHGPLKANSLIVVDVFPRMHQSGYYGDMTRTFLKGRASPAQRELVAAVTSAQKAALATIKAGVSGQKVHAAAQAIFEARGYKTAQNAAGVWEGFFHGTGHGLGLDLHEFPRIPSKEKLKAGHVFTVEPGLYYPDIGGCRIEDVVAVKAKGYAKLSRSPYQWELR